MLGAGQLDETISYSLEVGKRPPIEHARVVKLAHDVSAENRLRMVVSPEIDDPDLLLDMFD
jgi:hypothetical protein